MTKEGLMRLAKARHRVEQKSQNRHFSDESVLQMKRAYEIICERYESKIKELENMLKQARKLLMLGEKKCIYKGDEFQTEYRIKCNDFIGKIKHYLDEIENEGEYNDRKNY
jgi:hypothetical protein